MKISTPKTKVMAFLGTEPIRIKICIYDKVIEQVNHFTYLGNAVSYTIRLETSRTNYLYKYQSICGTMQRSLKTVRKDTGFKFYQLQLSYMKANLEAIEDKQRKQNTRHGNTTPKTSKRMYQKKSHLK